MKKILYTFLSLAGGITLISCSKDFTETKFYQQTQATPIKNLAELNSFVKGAYARMRNVNYLGCYYLGYGEARSDEMYNSQSTERMTYTSDYMLDPTKGDPTNTWNSAYRVIANANKVINAPDALTSMKNNTPDALVKQIKTLKAEAYAIRAIVFFDLLRLYGQKYTGGTLGIPLPLDFNPTATSTRATLAESEAQIEADFKKSLELFTEVASGRNLNTLVDTADKTYLSPLAVKVFLSRFYMYKGEFGQAATLSDEVINSNKYEIVPGVDMSTSFSKPNASNSVFELAVGATGGLGVSAYEFLLNSNGYGLLRVTPQAVNLYASNDVRKNLLTRIKREYFLDNKFTDLKGQSNIKLIRIEEVYLNAIEAHLRSDDPTGGGDKTKGYYNTLRQKRGLTATTTAVSFEELTKERSRELLGEGFRYWDLLRWSYYEKDNHTKTIIIPQYNKTGVADAANNKTVPNRLFAFPIPQSEIDSEYSNVTQNPGY